MSAAFVPGCILRFAFASIRLCSILSSGVERLPKEGDLGPIWISVGGGGLGSLGERGGIDIVKNGSLSVANIRLLYEK
jgi:hypothetical protein